MAGMGEEAIVLIRYRERPTDTDGIRDEYYTVPRELLRKIWVAALAYGRNSPLVRERVIEYGRRIDPKPKPDQTFDITER